MGRVVQTQTATPLIQTLQAEDGLVSAVQRHGKDVCGAQPLRAV